MAVTRTHSILVASALLSLLAAPLSPQVPVGAQDSAARRDSLPSADAIAARYHEAVGFTAFAQIQSLHSIGELAIPAAGITGTLEVWQARPNRTVMHASVPNYGDVRTGFTGENGWSLDPVEGARVLSGLEGAQAADDAHFDSHIRTAELVESMTTSERTTLSGYDCYMVRTVWKTGRQTRDCFSVDTGLLVGSVRTHHSSSGPTEALILYEEYRDFGEVRVPTRITTRVGGVDQVVSLRTVTLDGVDDSVFDPPAEVRALLGG